MASNAIRSRSHTRGMTQPRPPRRRRRLSFLNWLRRTAQDLNAIRSHYEIEDRAAVEAFLRQNPVARTVLIEAIDALPEYFPKLQSMSVRFRDYPEMAPHLSVRIDTGEQAEAARSRRDSFVDRWWLQRLPTLHGLMTMDVEYR